MRSKRLARQLKKSFGREDIVENLDSMSSLYSGQIKDEDWDTVRKLVRGMSTFCGHIEQAYKETDDMLEVAQRNIGISNHELSATNEKLGRLNQTFDAMVNSLGQGFVLFGRDGVCLSVYSKICEQLLDTVPPGKNIMDILHIPEAKRGSFKDWCEMLFDERLDFEDMAMIGPKRFDHSARPDKHISLEFKPVRGSGGAIELILMIATDRSDEVAAKRRADDSASFANMVIMLIKDRAQFRRFIQDARQLIEDVIQLVYSGQPDHVVLDLVAMKLHTLKGVSGIICAGQIKDIIHRFEERIREEHDVTLKAKMLGETVAQIESEFDIVLARIRELISGDPNSTREVSVQSLRVFGEMLQAGTHSPAELAQFYQERILSTPIQEIFASFNEVISQTAIRLKKRVKSIEMIGEPISVRRELHEPVWASLTNVFRNIVDHGIEAPSVRTSKGKSESGEVRVLVRKIQSESKASLEIKISDDGAGINLDALKQRLVQAGRSDFAHNATPKELMHTIFDQGISTAATVTDISGMGVGLSSVREAVRKCGGSIDVESQSGQGTTFILTLPLAA